MFAGLNLIIKKMKKLFIVLITIVFASCSQDQNESVVPVATASASVLEGKLLSYKDDATFIKEYSALTVMKSGKEVQKWIAEKGVSSLLNKVDTTEIVQDKMDNTKVIYSDALKAILNSDSKFKIDGKVLWLNENKFYLLTNQDKEKTNQELVLLKSKLKVEGTLDGGLVNGKVDKVGKDGKDGVRWMPFPDTNGYSVLYANEGSDSKRYELIFFVESITINGVHTRKVFVKSIMYYRRCPSFKKCYWRLDDVTARVLDIDVRFQDGCSSSPSNNNPYSINVVGEQTILLAGGQGYNYPCMDKNIYISGKIITHGFNNYIWELDL
jgi:hypothetical protein